MKTSESIELEPLHFIYFTKLKLFSIFDIQCELKNDKKVNVESLSFEKN